MKNQVNSEQLPCPVRIFIVCCVIISFVYALYPITTVNAATTYDSTSSLITYSGAWTHTSYVNAYGNTLSYSSSLNASATITFTGRAIKYVYSRASNRGQARIYLDGVLKDNVFAYSAKTRLQTAKIYEFPYGTHTLKVEVLGGAGVYTDIDAFVVDPIYAFPGQYDSAPGYYNQYIGNWSHSSSFPSAYSGTLSYSNTSEAAHTFTFYGNSVQYTFTKAPNRGVAAISIDGKDVDYINLYASTVQYQQKSQLYKLSPGLHVLHIAVWGESSSSGYYIDTDLISVNYFFAGYRYYFDAKGGSVEIGTKNPFVNTGHSAEWIMVNNGASPGGYVQIGWIKLTGDSEPKHFFEYSSSDTSGVFVRYRQYGTIVQGQSYQYRMETVVSSSTVYWCGYINGAQIPISQCVTVDYAGFNLASDVLFSGETTDNFSDLGGSSSSRLRMQILSVKSTSNTWYQVNTGSLEDITTPGSDYFVNKGFDTVTFMENWTDRGGT